MEMAYCAIVPILTKPFSLKLIADIYWTQDSGTRRSPRVLGRRLEQTLPLRPRTPGLAASFRRHFS